MKKRLAIFLLLTACLNAALGISDVAMIGQLSKGPLRAGSNASTLSTSGPKLTDVTTAATTVYAWGGTAPYTYAWAYFSGTAVEIDPDSPTSATTTFTGNWGLANTRAATFRCTVTDAAAATAPFDVTVTITYTN